MAGANDKVVTVTDDTFAQEVLQSDKPVLVDFWAVWCGPCRAIAPIVSELSNSFDGRLKVAKIDIDVSRQVAEQYRIMSIPTLMVFKGGKMVAQMVGNQGKAKIHAMVESNV